MQGHKPLVVVSGFPRTGTSTMMRMLELGGIPILADEDHREGRHEFDPYGDQELVGEDLKNVKNMELASTQGRAVKMVTPFIYHTCPLDRPVKVIFMLRDPREIVASLLAMRTVWEWDPIESVAHARQFLEAHNIPIQYIQYTDMLTFPRTTALMIERFLDRRMDVDEMVKAVDKDARKKIKGEGGQDRLVTYNFTKALVDDMMIVDLKEEKNGGKVSKV